MIDLAADGCCRMNLTKVAWSVFAIDVMLGAVMIIAALTDSGDAAGRGLAQVYAVACGLLLIFFGVILGVSTFFKSRIGLTLSIALMIAPPIVFFVGLARQLAE